MHASLTAMLGTHSPWGPLAFVSSSSACTCTQQQGSEPDGQQCVYMSTFSSGIETAWLPRRDWLLASLAAMLGARSPWGAPSLSELLVSLHLHAAAGLRA